MSNVNKHLYPSSPWFITATDTEVGKTWTTLALIRYWQRQGVRAVGMKPVAAGCEWTAEGWRNDDALQIWQLSRQVMPSVTYSTINPYAFIPPIAPHLAANIAGVEVDLTPILQAYQQLATESELVIVEGVGGWRVPLNNHQTLVDLVRALEAKVILVVGLRLGCINHALLTAETLERDGCQLLGWVANTIDAEYDIALTVDTLIQRLNMPLLATFPHLSALQIEALADSLKF